ncbi:MAG: hypothetical protein OXI83_09535, partial [Gemmatimonadota bacterium]|nr:hypothetical protein [Gemmatimonadota bacterium]
MNDRRGGDLSGVMRSRFEKLERLKAMGVEAFAYSCHVTRHAAPSTAAFEKDEAAGDLRDGHGETGRWAGRVMG